MSRLTTPPPPPHSLFDATDAGVRHLIKTARDIYASQYILIFNSNSEDARFYGSPRDGVAVAGASSSKMNREMAYWNTGLRGEPGCHTRGYLDNSIKM